MYHTKPSSIFLLSTLFVMLMLLFTASALAQDGFGRDGFPLPDFPLATDGSSNCFISRGSPGCDNAECEATVCASDGFCCDTAWDGLCVEGAIELCPISGSDEPRARFEVNKGFSDEGNPSEVLVTINCFTGLPLEQSQLISADQNVVFIVTDYDDGELDCEITESVPNGYSALYDPVPGAENSTGCSFENIGFGAFTICNILNSPDPVTVMVHKEWIYTNTESGDEVDDFYEVTLFCNEEIQGGFDFGDGNWRSTFSGNGDGTAIWHVNVEYGGATCYAEESVFDSGVESDNSNCDNLPIDIGQGAECTIVNTVFYEGIPTLSQYGVAILALVMLMIGVIGFRRFS